MSDKKDSGNMDEQWAAALKEDEETRTNTSNEEAQPKQVNDEVATDDAWVEAFQEKQKPQHEMESNTASPVQLTSGLDEALCDELEIEMTVELGRSKLTLAEIKAINQGTVIELDNDVKTPLKVFINGLLFCKGEVVQVNNSYGIRITEKTSKQERARNLSFNHSN